MAALWLLPLLFAFTAGQEIEYPVNSTGLCQIPGCCDGSNFDDIKSNVTDQDNCLSVCQGRDTCESWTYVPSREECWTFRAPCMIHIHNDTSVGFYCEEDCTSGDVSCMPAGEDGSVTCRLEEECNSTDIISNLDTTTADDCLAECKGNEVCQWYTWYSCNGMCLLFETCEETTPCEGCESGERDCELRQCDVHEECLGNDIVGNSDTDTADDCLAQCQANEDCAWFTWYPCSNKCLLYQSCSGTDQCQDCVSGEQDCPITP